MRVFSSSSPQALVLSVVLSSGCSPRSSEVSIAMSVPRDAHGIVALLEEHVLAEQLSTSSTPTISAVNRTSLSLSLEAFRGIQLAQSYVQETTEAKPDRFLKTEVFEFKADLNPFKLVSKKGQFLFPFSLSRNSAILVGRNFSTVRNADSSGVYELQDLPLSIENAEKMSVGDYVAMPVKLSVLASYSGLSLQSIFQKSGALKTLLSASAFGNTGAAMQGAVVANGDFTLHVLKVAPHKVRVRISVGNQLQLSASGSLSAGGNASISFTPHSALERGVSMGRSLRGVKREFVDRQNEMSFKKTFELLTPNQKRLGHKADWTGNVDFKAQLISASQTNDSALVNIPRNASDEAAAQETLETKAAQAASRAHGDWVGRVVKMTEQVDKLRRHSFHVSTNVALNSSSSRQIQALGEYVFDLSSSEGKVAFLHAVSGRSRWFGDDLAIGLLGRTENDTNQKLSTLLDFTLADRIATEDLFKSSKRVERIQLVESRKLSHSSSIQFSFQNASMGFNENQSKNQVILEDTNGEKTTYDLHTWRFQKKGVYAGIRDAEVRSSGFYTKSQSDVLASYYYSWSLDKSSQSSALREPLKHLLNVLGPEFYRSKIHLVWPSDYSGSATSSLEVVVNQSGMDRFFNTNLVSEDSLWVALREIAETWDNTFGLPFNNLGWVSDSTTSEEARRSCVVIAKEWGGGYCKFFNEVFLPSWRRASAQNGIERVRFFGEFYKQGFLVNKIGADLMMRLVLQVLSNSRSESSAADYMLRVQSSSKPLTNTNHILDYEYGSNPLHGVSEVLGLKMLML